MTVQVTYVVVFKDTAGEWHWTARAANNKNVATSGEGLENREWAEQVARDLFPDAEIKSLDEEE